MFGMFREHGGKVKLMPKARRSTKAMPIGKWK